MFMFGVPGFPGGRDFPYESKCLKCPVASADPMFYFEVQRGLRRQGITDNEGEVCMAKSKKEVSLKDPMVLTGNLTDPTEAMVRLMIDTAIKATAQFAQCLEEARNPGVSEKAMEIGRLLNQAELGCKDVPIRKAFSMLLGETIPENKSMGIPYLDHTVLVLIYTGRNSDTPDESIGFHIGEGEPLQVGQPMIITKTSYESSQWKATVASGKASNDIPCRMRDFGLMRVATEDEIRTFVLTLAANNMPRLINLLIEPTK